MSRWNDSLCERCLDDDIRFYTVPRPAADEGVGRALRAVYYPPADDALPPEMIDLLSRLDGVRFESGER